LNSLSFSFSFSFCFHLLVFAFVFSTSPYNQISQIRTVFDPKLFVFQSMTVCIFATRIEKMCNYGIEDILCVNLFINLLFNPTPGLHTLVAKQILPAVCAITVSFGFLVRFSRSVFSFSSLLVRFRLFFSSLKAIKNHGKNGESS
jgi:hypothetical protein